jgi:hypothetical protein
MGRDERDNLIQLLEGYQELQAQQHRDFKDALAEINKKLDPVFEVYSAYSGFGTIAIGFFKWVIVPISIILGIIISVRNTWLK